MKRGCRQVSLCYSIVSYRPGQYNLTPALLTKGTQEEQVFNSFLGGGGGGLIEHAGIIVPRDSEVSTFKHISGIQSIHQKQPPKQFKLDRALGLPKPAKSLIGHDLLVTMIIEFFRREAPERAFPGVMAAIGHTHMHRGLLDLSDLLHCLGREG